MLKFRQLMRRNQLEYNYINARLYAYSAAEILIEGARRTGKRITCANSGYRRPAGVAI